MEGRPMTQSIQRNASSRTTMLTLALIGSVLAQSGVAAAAQRPQAHSKPLHALALRYEDSPDGGFSVGVPAGWTLERQRTRGGTQVTAVLSPARDVIVQIWPVIPLDFLNRPVMAALQRAKQCYRMPFASSACNGPIIRAQLAYVSTTHSAREAAADLLSLAASNLSVVAMRELSPREVVVTLRMTDGAGVHDVVGDLQLFAIPNPIVGQGARSTFAFLSACETAAGRIAAERPTCAAIMASFHPRPDWIRSAVDATWQGYQREIALLVAMERQAEAGNAIVQQEMETTMQSHANTSAMIANFGNNMQRMQYQQFETQEASNYRVGEGNINALAGTTTVWNPSNPQEQYRVPSGYSNYCQMADGDFQGYSGPLAPSQCVTGTFSQGMQGPP
jgi:hypothetical protein